MLCQRRAHVNTSATGTVRFSVGSVQRHVRCKSSEKTEVETADSSATQPQLGIQTHNEDVTTLSSDASKRRARQADSTDAIASFLTRRFGLAGGLAWLGFLAVGSLGEQIKTRLEYQSEVENTKDVQEAQEVETPSGLRYTDLRIGGGSTPPRGYLVIVDFVAKANGEVFEDTRARGKPIVFLMGTRPFTGGMCPGTEEALYTMKAGGKRRVVIPPALGFGERGAVLRPTEHVPDKQGVIPANATLEYELELVRVSIPPS